MLCGQELLASLDGNSFAMSKLEAANTAVQSASQALGQGPAEPARCRSMRRGKYRNILGTQRANRHHRERWARADNREIDAMIDDETAQTGPAVSARIRERRHARQRARANIMRVAPSVRH